MNSDGVPQDTPITLQSIASPTTKPTQPPDLNNIAWIAAHDPTNTVNGIPMPRMPKLQAQIGFPTGYQVLWKLNVTFHDRLGNPHRDFDSGDPNSSNSTPKLLTDPIASPGVYTTDTPDQVIVPNPTNPSNRNDETSDGWKKITDGTPWKIWEDPHWMSAQAVGFFGGDATLSLKIMSTNGLTTIMPEQDWHFRIAGENPNPTLCKQYLVQQFGGPLASGALQDSPHTWFSWAIAKDETQGEGTPQGSPRIYRYYNHFLTDGGRKVPVVGHEGVPNWYDDGTKTSGAKTDRLTGTGGYGLFQLTYDADDPKYIMPRNWIWNWANSEGFAKEIQLHITQGQKLYDALNATYGTTNGPIPNYGNLPALDAIIVTYYNGMSGGQMTKQNRVTLDGYADPVHSCWKPTKTGWQFLQNSQSYAHNVNQILNEP